MVFCPSSQSISHGSRNHLETCIQDVGGDMSNIHATGHFYIKSYARKLKRSKETMPLLQELHKTLPWLLRNWKLCRKFCTHDLEKGSAFDTFCSQSRSCKEETAASLAFDKRIRDSQDNLILIHSIITVSTGNVKRKMTLCFGMQMHVELCCCQRRGTGDDTLSTQCSLQRRPSSQQKGRTNGVRRVNCHLNGNSFGRLLGFTQKVLNLKYVVDGVFFFRWKIDR